MNLTRQEQLELFILAKRQDKPYDVVVKEYEEYLSVIEERGVKSLVDVKPKTEDKPKESWKKFIGVYTSRKYSSRKQDEKHGDFKIYNILIKDGDQDVSFWIRDYKEGFDLFKEENQGKKVEVLYAESRYGENNEKMSRWIHKVVDKDDS